MRFLSPVLLAITLTASAADVHLSPEVAIASAATPSSAPYGQAGAAAASNGRAFLAIWNDQRSSVDGFSPITLYVSPLGNDGKPMEPLGRVLAPFSYSNALASDGVDFLAVFASETGLWSVRLDENGRPIDVARNIKPFTETWSDVRLKLAWNGTRYILVQSGLHGLPAKANVLDRNGNSVDAFVIPEVTTVAAVAGDGDGFVLVGSSRVESVLITIDGMNRRGARRLGDLPARTNLAATITGDRILTAAMSAASTSMPEKISVDTALFHRDGTPIASQHLYDATFPYGLNAFETIATGWDGAEYLVAWSQLLTPASLIGTRLHADGSRASEQFVIDPAAGGSPFQLVENASARLLLWSNGDIVSRPLSAFRDLASTSDLQVVSQSAPAQSDPLAASTPRGPMVVWDEQSSRRVLRGKIAGGAPFTIAEPSAYGYRALSASNSMALIVWTESGGVLGRRISFDGKLLDDAPITIASSATMYGQHSVASDGFDFLVTWSEGKVVVGSIVTSSGAVFPKRELSPRGDWDKYATSATWAGRRYVLAWTEDHTSDSNFPGSPAHGPAFVYASTVERDGTPATGSGLPLNPDETAKHAFLAPGAAGPRGVAIIWRAEAASGSCTHGITISSEGTVVDPARVITCTAGELNQKIAWDGGSFVVAWSQGFGSYFVAPDFSAFAIRLSADLQPLDPAPFVISTGVVAGRPALARTGSSMYIAYSRLADASYGNVARLYSRTLDATVTPPRQRAIRH